MRCLRFSSKSWGGDSKHRFSWGFFSINSSSSKSKSKSAPFSSSSQAHTNPSHAKQQAASSALPQEEQMHEEGEGTSSLVWRSKSELQVFTFAELRAVAGNFSRSCLLGEGGFGCVYKGTLKGNNPNDPQSAKEVAVKLLNRNGQQGHKEWLAEVRFLGLVEHPNLVKLVGYCAEDDERGIQRLLVYEYMARGSLEDYLFRLEYPVLTWQQRLQIILGAAQGLAYLHEGMDLQVIFRDFKTSNVLLAEDWTPKLSDFGLARQGPEMGASHVSTSVVGTIGYAAPEYVQTGRLTLKSDVWSFGVVLFEILTGRRSVDQNRPKREQHLLEWVKPYLHGNNKKVYAIMDPRLEGDHSLIQAEHIVDLALHCCNRAPKARPSMSVVVKRLKYILEAGKSQDRDTQLLTPSVEAKGFSKSKQQKAPSKEREFLVEEVKNREWFSEPIPIPA